MGLIKPHLVIAEPSGQPHIGRWEGRPSYPPAYLPAGTTLP